MQKKVLLDNILRDRDRISQSLKVFIVDGDDFYKELLAYSLSENSELEVQLFSTAESLLEALDQKPGLVTLDYSLPDMKGDEVLKKIKAFDANIPVVIVSGQEDISIAISLLNEGAHDYIIKNKNSLEKLWTVIRNVIANVGNNHTVSQHNQGARKQLNTEIVKLTGTSKELNSVLSMIEKAINSNITVSIFGETGTGKEIAAKAIHYNSNKASLPFVAVNVNAIPHGLVESELFGHEKGAFTGALNARKGKFEEAAGGTLFLDEVGDMDLNVQSKLLRVLQEKEVTRIGGNKVIKINCRLITATHKDLTEEVKKGNFREDLYYRLLGLPIGMPALRERGDDILQLANHFINGYILENNVSEITINEAAQTKLLNHSWPGNVRELKAVILLACVMIEGGVIRENDIIFGSPKNRDSFLETEKTLDEYKKEIISHFMKKYNDDVLLVAKKLDIGKSTIYRLIQNSDI